MKQNIIYKNIELEKEYRKQNGETNNNRLYPNLWYEIKNPSIRQQILEEAISKKILIKETEIYKRVADNLCTMMIQDNIKKTIENNLKNYK